MKHLKTYEQKKGKFINVDYKIIVKDLKDNPNLIITNFKIIKHEDKKLEIKAKGYIKKVLDESQYKKVKGWVEFDDFKDDNTRRVYNKHFENGNKRIKIYL